jgi:hypothetical protein
LSALAEIEGTFGQGDSLDVAALLSARFAKYRAIGVFTMATDPLVATGS